MLRKAKKTHICAVCRREIYVGDVYEDTVECIEGEYTHIRKHVRWPRDMATPKGIKEHVLGVVFTPNPMFLTQDWDYGKYNFRKAMNDEEGHTIRAAEFDTR